MGVKRVTKGLSLFLCIILVVTSILLMPVQAGSAIQKKTFQFPNLKDHVSNMTSSFYYTDDYFKKSGYEYNPSLATMSMCMASAAMGSNEGANTKSGRVYSSYPKNVSSLLKNAGFDSFEANEDYIKKPTKESVGYAFAKKKIKGTGEEFTLIAINFRNALYEKEWVSNLQYGTSNIHQGFQEAGTKVLEGLKNYIQKKNIKGPVKFWVAGYSRGAGIANYVAYRLDESFDVSTISFKPMDVYAYTFATPNITSKTDYKKSTYGNIFNIVSPYDLVTKVVPEQFGIYKFGQVISLPMKSSDKQYQSKKERAQKFLNQMIKNEQVVTEEIQGYQLNMKSLSSAGFEKTKPREVSDILDELMAALAYSFGDIKNLEEVQPAIRTAIDFSYDSTPQQQEKYKNYVTGQIDKIGSNMIFIDIILGGEKLATIIMDGFKEAGYPVENEDEVRASVKKGQNYQKKAILSNTKVVGGDIYATSQSFNEVFGNHMNYRYLAWLQSIDSNYSLVEETKKKVNVGKVKILSVKRKSPKKLSIKIKKISNAKGYQIKVYSSYKKAKKNKGAVVKKLYKKNVNKMTVSSKKIKNKKKLYLRIRAYRMDGKNKKFGKWSKIKKTTKKK